MNKQNSTSRKRKNLHDPVTNCYMSYPVVILLSMLFFVNSSTLIIYSVIQLRKSNSCSMIISSCVAKYLNIDSVLRVNRTQFALTVLLTLRF